MSSLLIKWFIQNYFADIFEDLKDSMMNISLIDQKMEIQNISINKKVIEMLEWPIDLCYSCIQKFSLELPIFKLDEKPCSLTMSDVLIIVQRRSRNKWKFEMEKEIKKIEENIEKYIQKLLEEFNDKLKQKKREEK